MDDLTIIIKTIHRPWACARLIKSIREHAGSVKIHVLDDGQPDTQFQKHYPTLANSVDRMIHADFDIGLSAGRNRLLDTVETPYFFTCDDDHYFTAKTDLPGLLDALKTSEMSILGCRNNGIGFPRSIRINQKSKTIRMVRRKIAADARGVIPSDFIANSFVAETDVVSRIRWDERLKIHEHWDFFLRAKQAGVKVGWSADHDLGHSSERNRKYRRFRNRRRFGKLALRIHELRRIKWINAR